VSQPLGKKTQRILEKNRTMRGIGGKNLNGTCTSGRGEKWREERGGGQKIESKKFK